MNTNYIFTKLISFLYFRFNCMHRRLSFSLFIYLLLLYIGWKSTQWRSRNFMHHHLLVHCICQPEDIFRHVKVIHTPGVIFTGKMWYQSKNTSMQKLALPIVHEFFLDFWCRNKKNKCTRHCRCNNPKIHPPPVCKLLIVCFCFSLETDWLFMKRIYIFWFDFCLWNFKHMLQERVHLPIGMSISLWGGNYWDKRCKTIKFLCLLTIFPVWPPKEFWMKLLLFTGYYWLEEKFISTCGGG